MSAVSLPAVKAFLNISATDNDDELLDMVDRAEAVLAARVGPLEPVTVTDEVHTGPGPVVLRKCPVLEVTAATADGAAVTDLDLNPESGVLYGTFGHARRAVKVSYLAGREVLPPDLEAAVLELTQHLWQSQRVPGAGRRGFTAADPDERALQGVSSYLLPYRVQTLIDPYLLPALP